jgi:hypothetical protein
MLSLVLCVTFLLALQLFCHSSGLIASVVDDLFELRDLDVLFRNLAALLPILHLQLVSLKFRLLRLLLSVLLEIDI